MTMPSAISAARRAQVSPGDVTLSSTAVVTGAQVKPGEVSKVLPTDRVTKVITLSHGVASAVTHTFFDFILRISYLHIRNYKKSL
jgi:hypothetical protein